MRPATVRFDLALPGGCLEGGGSRLDARQAEQGVERPSPPAGRPGGDLIKSRIRNRSRPPLHHPQRATGCRCPGSDAQRADGHPVSDEAIAGLSPARFEAISPDGTMTFDIAAVLKRTRRPAPLPLTRVSGTLVGHFDAATQTTPLVPRGLPRGRILGRSRWHGRGPCGREGLEGVSAPGASRAGWTAAAASRRKARRG